MTFTNTHTIHIISSPESRYEPQPSYVHPNFPESYIQQDEGEPSENYKKELEEYFNKNGGGQLAFRDQQAEVESDNGKPYHLELTDEVSGRFYICAYSACTNL